MRRALPALPIAAATLLLAAISPLEAQKEKKEPRRPKLEASADTNDPRAYFELGMDRAQKRPKDAADAFYWASRLAPGWADPLYGRWAALHLAMPQHRRIGYWTGDRRAVESDEVRSVDSLLVRAYQLNPFLRRPLERLRLESLVPASEWYEFRQMLDEVAQRNPSAAAWFASSDGRYRDAVKYYGQAIKKSPRALHFRNERARAYFYLGMHDSATADLAEVVSLMRAQEEKEVVYLYESKAMLEHSIGVLWSFRGNVDSAKAAYTRALEEDLSFYQAHAALGMIALTQGDTATALGEYGMAAQLAPENGALQHEYAMLLIKQNKAEEALGALRKAIEIEPYFAEPYYYLARLHDVYGFTTDARREYAEFAARTTQADTRRQFALARSAELAAAEATPTDASAKPTVQ